MYPEATVVFVATDFDETHILVSLPLAVVIIVVDVIGVLLVLGIHVMNMVCAQDMTARDCLALFDVVWAYAVALNNSINALEEIGLPFQITHSVSSSFITSIKAFLTSLKCLPSIAMRN